MAYIIGLFIILGLIFSAGFGSHSFEFLGNLNPNKLLHIDQLKDRAIEAVNPKSESEKLVESVKKDQATLEQFLSSDTTKKILQSSVLSPKDKEVLSKAVSAVQQTKIDISKLEQAVKNNKNIASQAVSKILNLNENKTSEETGPEPTYIPPSCHVQCDK